MAPPRSGYPEEKLIVYGSLVPGGLYHFLLSDLPGTWEPCVIRGRMGECWGFRVFHYDAAGPEHPAWILTSPALPGLWPELDDFEGDNYERIVIPARLNGRWIRAQVYAGKYSDEAFSPRQPGAVPGNSGASRGRDAE